MSDDRDLAPDNGQRPPFAKPDPALGKVGQGEGYSGQEYDGASQAAWRRGEDGLDISPDGEPHGTGSPREEIDVETPGADTPPSSGTGQADR
jgi:hypothetical protein